MAETLEADIEARKFTQESVANAKLSPELQNRIWTLLFDTDARTLFQKLFIDRMSAEERRVRIRKMYSTNRALYEFVRHVVGRVAEKDSDAADELAAVLKGESRPIVNDTGEVGTGLLGLRNPTDTGTPLGSSTVLNATEGQYRQQYSPQNFSAEHFARVGELIKDDVWVDEWDLPLPLQSDGYPIDDGRNKKLALGDRERAELKLASLSGVYRGEVMRWNRENHQAGKYGDPKDSRTYCETGWIIQIPHSAHTASQECGRQPSQAREELTEQRQGQTASSRTGLKGRIIFLSPAHMKVLQIDPWPILSMPTPWVLAHRDPKSESDGIAMQERIDFDAWLKDTELQPAMRAQIETILKEIDSQ